MNWLFEKVTGWVMGFLGIVFAILVIYTKGKSDQRIQADAEEHRKRLEAIKRAGEVDDEISKLNDAALDRKLERWLRD